MKGTIELEPDWAEEKVRDLVKQALDDLELVAGHGVVEDFIKLFSLVLKQEREAAEAKWKKIEWPSEEEIKQKVFSIPVGYYGFGFNDCFEWLKEWVEAKRK